MNAKSKRHNNEINIGGKKKTRMTDRDKETDRVREKRGWDKIGRQQWRNGKLGDIPSLGDMCI